MESGKVIAGKYRLNSLLGSGGMAEVWSATNTFTERQLAIKFMTPQVAKTPEAAARFLKEAKVSARINHPSVIDIQDVGQTEDGQLFLVMELLTGFPLEVAMKRQTPPMTLFEFALVMIEVGSALEAAHKSGIVHRDLKPTNIFLHKGSGGVAVPKLLDFGVSKFLEDDQNHALTIAGTVLGSPLYMSPEQARGDNNIDGRTDVFAFGAILFEAVCGYRAYDARNFNALIVKIATTPPRRIDECAPGVPECFRRVVRACMDPDPKTRIASFAPIVEMLRAASNQLRESPMRLPTPVIATASGDPDATNALPIVNASTGSHRPPEMSNANTGPSWHTPNTSYASVSAPPPKKAPGMWIGVALGVVAMTALAAGGGVAWKMQRNNARLIPAAVAAKPPPPTTTAPPANDAVSIDSLPSAQKALGPVPKGSGRLYVSASPKECTLVVDGNNRGLTPVAALDLTVGAHSLECKPPVGKVRQASITVQEGATSRFKFAFDE